MTGWDLVIRGGQVIDGTGAPAILADVAVVDGRFAAVGRVEGVAGTQIDATGRIVCPGFVDIHTHSDLTLLSAPEARSKVHQGVTTEVVGNCGLGVAPIPPGADVPALREAVSYLDLDPTVAWAWETWAEYAGAVEAAAPSVNVASLVGHVPLRAGVVGFDDRAATSGELDLMCGLLGNSLDAGAIGLSTGLMYSPVCFADTAELAALGRVVAGRGAVFAWHLRDYSDDLISAVEEALQVARVAGCHTQISHLATVGRRNWGNVRRALDLVAEARSDGIDVGVDIYPYLAGNAPLSQRLPGWVQAGGEASMRARLTDPEVVDRVRASWVDQAVTWDEVTINSVPGGGSVVGRTVTELAEAAGTDADTVATRLLLEFGNAVTMVAGGRDVGDLRAALSDPSCVVGSDGQALDTEGPTGKGIPHPRSYGAYARLLSDYVQDGTLSLVEAIHKSTAAAAARVGLTGRGVVAEGAAADLVVLDPDRIADRATYAEPRRHPDGIDTVIVNGQVTVAGGRHTGARSGQLLRARHHDSAHSSGEGDRP